MRKILFAMLLAILLTGVVNAQQTTGEQAETVRKQILKIEAEKVAGLLKGGSEPADWHERYDTEDLVNMMADGSTRTRSQLAAELRSGDLKVVTMKQYEHRVFVYNNGTIAVVTNLATGTLERKGKSSPMHSRFTDVWVKQAGAWRRVVHDVANIPN